jgi:Zn-finger nucleic acid-binding protein
MAWFAAKQGKSNLGKCPLGHSGLQQIDYEGLQIKECLACRGRLLKQDQLNRILIRKEKGFGPQIQQKAKALVAQSSTFFLRQERVDTALLLDCPSCQKKMTRMFYNLAYPVEIDKCYTCDLLWFDPDELAVLQYLIDNPPEAEKLKEI